MAAICEGSSEACCSACRATPNCVAQIASGFGLRANEVASGRELEQAVSEVGSEPRVIEIRTNRTANVETHRAIASAVADALSGV